MTKAELISGRGLAVTLTLKQDVKVPTGTEISDIYVPLLDGSITGTAIAGIRIDGVPADTASAGQTVEILLRGIDDNTFGVGYAVLRKL